ncbi:MAG TPA: hydroxymethylbilane synthase [Actinomycetota bacterium]|nr:hydroxymethylbilane synthase [Actinomycetota bacterium]
MRARFVIASRGSKLALAQSEQVAAFVRTARPGLEVTIRTVTTKGDIDRRPFTEIAGKNLFTSEVEREVVENRADVAVHSAKDLTAQLHPDCLIVCVPRRAARHDVVVGGTGTSAEERLGRLPDGARVGTSSIRRRALLAEARPDLEAVEFRGNLDTRLRKLRAGEAAAALLAAAGIERLGITEEVNPVPLDPTWWVPAPAQGALAVEARRDRPDLAELFSSLEDERTRAEIECERAFGLRLEGGCALPLGCCADSDDRALVVTGYVGRPDGSQAIRDRVSGPFSDASALGRELADALLSGGGDDILDDVRAEAAER